MNCGSPPQQLDLMAIPKHFSCPKGIAREVVTRLMRLNPALQNRSSEAWLPFGKRHGCQVAEVMNLSTVLMLQVWSTSS